MAYSTEIFNKHFSVYLVNTKELEEECFKIRYKIFCEEKNIFEPIGPDVTVEHDIYDNYSLHYIIKHNSSDTFIATSRLILPSRLPFPLESVFKIDYEGTGKKKTGEFSRLCILKESKLLVPPDISEYLSHLSTVLIACGIRDCLKYDIKFIICSMRKALQRQLVSKGLIWNQIGDPKDYHGIRIPYRANVDALLNEAKVLNRDTYCILTDIINRG